MPRLNIEKDDEAGTYELEGEDRKISIWPSETEELDEDEERQTVDCFIYSIMERDGSGWTEIDGGCCTGSLDDAIEMARKQTAI